MTVARAIDTALVAGISFAMLCRSVDGALGALALWSVFQLMKAIR